MTKAQLQDILDCQMAKCRFLRRCTVYWGRRCVRQSGKRIPRMRTMQNIETVDGGRGSKSRNDWYRTYRVEGVVTRIHQF